MVLRHNVIQGINRHICVICYFRMWCVRLRSDFKSVSELRLTRAFYTPGHVSGVICGGMYRTFPTVKNPLHLTNQSWRRLGQRLRSRAYRYFIGRLQVVAGQGVSACQSKPLRLCGRARHVPWRLSRVWENSAHSGSRNAWATMQTWSTINGSFSQRRFKALSRLAYQFRTVLRA